MSSSMGPHYAMAPQHPPRDEEHTAYQPQHRGDEHTSYEHSPSPNASTNKSMQPAPSHQLAPNDPENPMSWSLSMKLYTSAVSFFNTWVVAFGITSYTAGITEVTTKFNVSMMNAQLGFSIIFFGIFFAPIVTPHITERFGRKPVYIVSIILFGFCILGVGLSPTFSGVLALRFLAGLFGGPCLVLIEGTFADIWSAQTTVTYYSFLTCASYIGAASGPLIGGFIFASKKWVWLNWITLIFAASSLLFGVGMPETYGREILRRRNKRNMSGSRLPAAQSGETLGEMATHTIINPLKMLVSEPIVVMITLYLGLNFGVVFQWFITVPAVLSSVYNFSIQRIGLAMISAIGGVLLATVTSTLLEMTFGRPYPNAHGMASVVPLEKRLLPAMFGSVLLVASLFWIGFTASPNINFLFPIFGTAVYVWGNACVLISLISYLFDAYPPAGTLSALTTAACFRILCAGIIPIFILQMFMNLTGAWALSVFGFISLAFLPFPFVLYKWGATLRAKSHYSVKGGMMSTVEMEAVARAGMMENNNMA